MYTNQKGTVPMSTICGQIKYTILNDFRVVMYDHIWHF